MKDFSFEQTGVALSQAPRLTELSLRSCMLYVKNVENLQSAIIQMKVSDPCTTVLLFVFVFRYFAQ